MSCLLTARVPRETSWKSISVREPSGTDPIDSLELADKAYDLKECCG